MSHPDERIDIAYRDKMNALASALDKLLNGEEKGENRKIAFVLLLTEFDHASGRVNYISNGQRGDIVTMLKEILARFEGQPELEGSA